MGNLSNLYISQSYQSLIHLGTNNALVSGTMTQLQDGVGNSLNFYVDGTNISSSGNIYASNLTSSLPADTASFATTGSNTFRGNQNINGNVNITGSLTASGLFYPTTAGTAGQFMITNGTNTLSFDDVHVLLEDVRYGESITLGDPLYVSGSNGTRPVVYKANAAIASKMPVIYVATSTAVANTNTTALTLGLITGVTTTGYPAGTTIYVAEGTAGWSASRPSGSASIVQALGIVTKEGPGGSGRGLVLNPGPATLPNLQTGYAWVGNGGNQPVAVLTSSFGGGGGVPLTSLNTFTQSIIGTNPWTASVDQKFATIGGQSGSWGGGGSINTSSFATTGSNTFRGNQTLVSSSIAIQGSGTLTFPNGLNFSGNSNDISNITATTTIQLITEPPEGPGGEGNSIKFINRVANSVIQFDNQQSGAANPINFIGGAANFTLTKVGSSTGKLNINAAGGVDTTNSILNAGTISASVDMNVNSLTIGKGGGNVSTNIAFGLDALKSNTTAAGNIAIGNGALQWQTLSGTANNTAIGNTALQLLGSGSSAAAARLNQNTVIGGSAGAFLITGARNTIIGALAFQSADNVQRLTGIGRGVFSGIGSGAVNNGSGSQYNTAIGHNALFSLQSGSNNIILHGGSVTGEGFITGSRNIVLGMDSGLPASMENSTIIGRSITGLISPLSNAVVLADGQGNVLLNRPSLNATTQISSSIDISGSVSITQTLKLSALDPLPSAVNGTMAVSGSNLYFSSGSSWFKVTLG